MPSAKQPRQAKTANTLEAVERYLASVPEPARSTILQVRETIRGSLPSSATEEMGYGVPAFRCNQLVAGYVARKKFCSYYPMSGRVITKLAADIKPYETTKGAIHFPLDQPLPAALIKKLVHARLREIEAKRQPQDLR